jgi:hypothetical protein
LSFSEKIDLDIVADDFDFVAPVFDFVAPGFVFVAPGFAFVAASRSPGRPYSAALRRAFAFRASTGLRYSPV